MAPLFLPMTAIFPFALIFLQQESHQLDRYFGGLQQTPPTQNDHLLESPLTGSDVSL